jgi:acid phosphatase
MRSALIVFTLAAQPFVHAATSSEPAESTMNPSLPAIQSAAATATPISPVSNVKGVAFDRFYQVWLENTDYDSASGNGDQQ